MPEELFEPAACKIPDKLYFRVGEVSQMVGVPAYVLRYWETEFPEVAPKKSQRGHRRYRRKDVELFLLIKDLLYVKRFTIEGARKALKAKSRSGGRQLAAPPTQTALFPEKPPVLKEIREELEQILQILK